jgi:dTDP-4-amino-4,6-dideoxygalactose transaminase
MSPSIPFLDHSAQHLGLASELEEAFRVILTSCSFCSGPAVNAFEKKFASYTSNSECIGVNSGTSALHLALLGSGGETRGRSNRSSHDIFGNRSSH